MESAVPRVLAQIRDSEDLNWTYAWEYWNGEGREVEFSREVSGFEVRPD